MGQLRERMIGDMVLRDFRPKTQEAYLHAVESLVEHCGGRPPGRLTPEDIRGYFLHLVKERKLSASTVRQQVCGVRFFFETTLGRQWEVFDLITPNQGRRLPVVLSREEVTRLLNAVHNARNRMALLFAYCCGLRLMEVLTLRVPQIDRERHQVRVLGKGRKERNVPMSTRLLERFDEYCRVKQVTDYVFASPLPLYSARPVNPKWLQTGVKLAAREAGITKNVCVHTFRHCFATHLLECGVDLRIIQEMLGHTSPQTTAIYTHLTDKSVNRLMQAMEEISSAL